MLISAASIYGPNCETVHYLWGLQTLKIKIKKKTQKEKVQDIGKEIISAAVVSESVKKESESVFCHHRLVCAPILSHTEN